MEDLTCSVCSEVFEGGVREPSVLPQCGHTFCRPCLLNLQDADPAFRCPTCRSPYSGPPVEDLPVVYAMLNLVATYSNMTAQPKVLWEECHSHGDPVRLWCQPCQEPLCGQCLYEGHMKMGHHVLRTQAALDHERQELESKASRVSSLIEDKRKNLTLEFHEVTLRLADIYGQTGILSRYSKTVTDVLQATKETNHMKTLITNRRMMEKLLAKLEASDGYVSDGAKRTVPGEPGPEDEGSKREDVQTVVEGRQQESDAEDDGSQPRGQEANGSRDDERDPQASQENGDNPRTSQDEGNDPPVSQRAGDEPETRLVGCEEKEEGECFWWRLSRCAPGGSTRWPRLNWSDFMAKLPVAQLLVPPQKPVVFLQLGVGERNLGRVLIRLWGHLQRAQHFLALCLGTLGPSYRGSRFSYVARKGEPGERLVGGVYLTEDGGQSSTQLIQGLEWRGEYLGPATVGIVGGSRGRQAKFNSCFCISSRDNPIGQYYCPFGEVVSGLRVVQEAVQYDPVTEVSITDVGLIVTPM